MWSTRVVLPWSTCATMAMLRSDSFVRGMGARVLSCESPLAQAAPASSGATEYDIRRRRFGGTSSGLVLGGRPMKRSRLVTTASLVGLVFVLSCMPGAKAPQVTPQRTLELGGEGGNTTSTRPFGVVFASPHGATVDPSEVTIVFNRPMRPLDLAGEEASPPASIVVKGTQVSPRGAWRWMGTMALVFAPEPRLPRATELEVTVPAGTKALDGSVLAKPYAFSFATARPEVARLDPGEGEMHLLPTQSFDARFNQPVDPKEVERAAKVELGDGKTAKPAPFKASWPEADNKTLVRITPSAPLPLGTHVE